MAHENDVAIAFREGTPGHLDVIRERDGWVLNDADVVAVFSKELVNRFPTGTIHEAAVDENDIFHSRIRFRIHNDVFFLRFGLFSSGRTKGIARRRDSESPALRSSRMRRHRPVSTTCPKQTLR